tara:strand:- start:1044 stop:1157 length:114 start_codon:yes stop_codon:yes gene_type:complete
MNYIEIKVRIRGTGWIGKKIDNPPIIERTIKFARRNE